MPTTKSMEVSVVTFDAVSSLSKDAKRRTAYDVPESVASQKVPEVDSKMSFVAADVMQAATSTAITARTQFKLRRVSLLSRSLTRYSWALLGLRGWRLRFPSVR